MLGILKAIFIEIWFDKMMKASVSILNIPLGDTLRPPQPPMTRTKQNFVRRKVLKGESTMVEVGGRGNPNQAPCHPKPVHILLHALYSGLGAAALHLSFCTLITLDQRGLDPHGNRETRVHRSITYWQLKQLKSHSRGDGCLAPDAEALNLCVHWCVHVYMGACLYLC